ncbi:zinc finger (CCCH-type) family protein [Arabidopsis lyrata subsp. lyrata]|uniref:Zinc finger (CCCH-type) family protein n=1 Tax=Arabidopsis lyrata subsp. lyrata TaxID=81972 RepID=D7MMZ4_ARALL|nr:zinc finger (CCCH-type) family protein [Arabidopsis lyrata subsp. lyrata]
MMKKTKKSRVSWASDSMLCQVKLFLTDDCPAKVASNLPPGFEATEYATRRILSHIPRIKWKRPPKVFVLNDALLVGRGGESTETRTENLRISKVLEAFYPHRSVIPTRPSVSPAVEEAHYDDRKTPNIRLTPVEDEREAAVESSHSFEAPAAVSGLGPELSLLAAAALSALTKEQGCQVDADLLVKLLSDPKIVESLINDMKGKPLETANNSRSTDTNKPRLAPQHVTSTAMDRNPPPIPGNVVPHNVPVFVQSSATDPPLSKPTQPMSSTLSVNVNLQKPTLVVHSYPLSSAGIKLEDSYTAAAPLKPSPVDDVVVSEQKTQSLNMSSTWNMNRVPESARTETDAKIRNGNTNQDGEVSAKPVKNLDYFKSLIREHGAVKPATNETNNYKGRVDDKKVVKVKIQKPCMYFNRAKGCRLGESCLYLHDRSKRLWTDVAPPHFPRAKRLKFRS